MAYQKLADENLNLKSPGPPGRGLMQQTSTLIIEKKIAKNPLEILWTPVDPS